MGTSASKIDRADDIYPRREKVISILFNPFGPGRNGKEGTREKEE